MNARLLFGAALAALAMAAVAHAAEPGTFFVRDATVHTVGPRGTLAHADVLVERGRVKAIGTKLTVPAGVEVVEAGGRPLTPGLFAGLSGLGLDETGGVPAADDSALRLGRMRPEFDVALAFNPDAIAIGVSRVAGLTFGVISPQSESGGRSGMGGSIIAGQGAVVRHDGSAAPLSRALFASVDGDVSALSGGSRAGHYMLLSQAISEVRNPAQLVDGDDRLLTPAGREVLGRYLKGAGPLVVRVDRAADIRQVLAFARRENVSKLVLTGAAEAWRVAPELARAKVTVFVDPFTDLPENFDAVGATLENAARLARAGVTVGFSLNDHEPYNLRKVRQAAGLAVANGLPWDTALAALTRVPAEAFGVADRVGSIAVGRPADFVLWSGDPLEVTSAPEHVWIDGVRQPDRSRQTDLRDRYLEKLKRGDAR